MTPKQIRKIPGLGRSFGVYDRGLILDRMFKKVSEEEAREVHDKIWDHLTRIGLGRESYTPYIRDCENISLSVSVRFSEEMYRRYAKTDPVSRLFNTVLGNWRGSGHAWSMAQTPTGLLHFNYGSVFTASDANCKLDGGIFI